MHVQERKGETRMAKSQDAKKNKLKPPQRTAAQKRQAKLEKRNK